MRKPKPQKSKHQPALSWYQQKLRFTAIKLILVFMVLAAAAATGLYYYQSRSFIP
jgi:hypothetical protein